MRITPPATYAEVSFNVAAAVADEAAGILVAHGALGCEVKKIRGSAAARPRHVCLNAYFERATPQAIAHVTRILRSAGMLAEGRIPLPRAIRDPGWATMWQTRFEPLEVGDHFLVVPPWHRVQDCARIQIVIRPGQAFGTGHHASTYGILALIEQLHEPRRIKRALDVGTGSGILAIAMAKLGTRNITAIDLDATALANGVENAALNRVAGAIRFSTTPLESVRGRFDLIAANILSSVLIAMAPQLVIRLRPHGHLLLAGILKREAREVIAAYRPALKLFARRDDGKWTALAFQR